MKKLLFLFLTLVYFYALEAQNEGVHALLMTTKTDNYRHTLTIPPRTIQYDQTALKGIPKDLDKFAVALLSMQLKQSIYQRLKSGELDPSEYQRLKKVYHIDEGRLSEHFVKQGVHILTGIKAAQKIIICDANNNMDFSDDSVHVYDLRLPQKTIPWDSLVAFKIHYDYYYNGKIWPRHSYIKVRPYDHAYQSRDSVDKLMSVFVSVVDRKVTPIQLGDKKYHLTLPFSFYRGGDYSHANVLLSDATDQFTIATNPVPKIGDSFKINGWKVQLLSASEFGDTLHVRTWQDSSVQEGYREGFKTSLPDFETLDHQRYNTQQNPHRYTVLDFWGTWCAPCVAGLPHLKAFYKKYKNRLTLISIAYDKDPQKVRRFVADHQMTWIQKFESNTEPSSESLVEKLKVDCFPTFILIDQNGEILIRGCGEQHLKAIEAFLN
ncbi:MAG: TlpA family protein disulfide reductase [Runella sp.]